jgi:hypothetical protein
MGSGCGADIAHSLMQAIITAASGLVSLPVPDDDV